MADELADFTSRVSSERYALKPLRRDFAPWHKPRKQVVRHRQIDFLLDPIASTGDGPIRYLGLPGTDLLDIRWISSGLCVRHDRDLLFCGFDTSAPLEESRFTIEEAKTRGLPRIDPRSIVLKSRFESLADVDSFGFRRASEVGAFDLINLDLCNGLAQEAPAASAQTLYNALARLIGLQATRDRPWVLMITTRVDDNCFDGEVAEKLAEIFVQNCSQCEEFAEASANRLGGSPKSTADLDVGDTALLAQLRSTALCKWLMRLCISRGMEASLESALSYTVNPRNGHPDLLALAFTVEPAPYTAASDSYGLAQLPDDDPVTHDNCAEALRALDRIFAADDVDAILRRDGATLSLAIDQSIGLLTSAGYSESEYRAWLDAKGLR